MSSLSTEDNTRQSADDAYLDEVNPVVRATAKSWQRLLAQSEWTPQRFQPRCLSSEDEPAPRHGVRVVRGRGYAACP